MFCHFVFPPVRHFYFSHTTGSHAASVMGASQTWIDIGCDGFLCLLWASRPGQVTQCLLWPSVEFFLGYQARNSLPSEGLSNSFFEANDTERGLVSYDTSVDHDDLDKLEQNSVVKVKGRLRENIAFWRSIGASQWLLNVLCEGYCLPFVDC